MSDPVTDFLAARLGGAKAVQNRHPFIEHGNHRLALEEYRMTGQPGGRALVADLRVIASTKHKPGSMVCERWQLEGTANFPGDDKSQERDRSVNFIARLFGTDDLALAASTSIKLAAGESVQPAKGMLIDCAAALMPAKKKKNGEPGKPYVNRTWFRVEQTKEQIKAQRTALESTPAVVADAAPLTFTPPPGIATAVQAASPAPATTPAPAQAAAETGPSLLDTLGL